MVSDVVLKKLDPDIQRQRQEKERVETSNRSKAMNKVLPHIMNNKNRKQQQLKQHQDHQKRLITRERQLKQ